MIGIQRGQGESSRATVGKGERRNLAEQRGLGTDKREGGAVRYAEWWRGHL